MEKSIISYFSMFSGIGGFELGIQQANKSRLQMAESSREKCNILRQRNYEDFAKWNERILCVGFSEIDKYAIQIYKKHFPSHKEYGDVSNITWSNVEDFSLLAGGFPCQSFSIAGKRRGFDDTRGTLFFEIARCLREKQPRLLCLENVKGLLSHDKGRTFGVILNTLDEIGYDLQWQVLNSKNFGVPQNRERVFVVGHLRETHRPEVFPLGESNGNSISGNTKTTKQLASTITGKYGTGNARGTHIRTNEPGTQPQGDMSSNNNSIRRASYSDDMRIRRLTPTECERLQGFPDGWTEGISDTQRYKCLGNAVTVNVTEAIAGTLFD